MQFFGIFLPRINLISQPSKTPQPGHWTFRFKNNKITVVLLVSETQSFESIKRDLLDALNAANIKTINNQPVPSEPDSIAFGVPVDKNDYSKGWVGIEIPELDDGTKPKKAVKRGSVLNEHPLGAGLADGMVIAFQFKTEGGEVDSMMDEDERWDVVMPSYDDDVEMSQDQASGR